MKLLHIDSSVTGLQSVSRQLSASIVKQLQRSQPDLDITYRDVAAAPLPQLSPEVHLATLLQMHALDAPPGALGTHIAAAIAAGAQAQPAAHAELGVTSTALEQFLAADIIVIGAPMYTFSIPSQLKAWLDCLSVPGKTFSYTATGVQGLAGGKRVIIASARGGLYTAPSPMAGMDHHEALLQAFFGFIGVTDLQVVRAEGLNMGPQQRQAALEAAMAQVAGLTVA